jgi:DNA gyrase inhibitor GyrI
MSANKAIAAEAPGKLNLSSEPQQVILPTSNLAYLEKIGPFLKTAPLAWKKFWSIATGQLDKSSIAFAVGLSRIDETKTGDAAYVYQAGVLLKTTPSRVPDGLQMRAIKSGKYARFWLTGSYSQLPAAYPAAFSILKKAKLELRKDFCIEKYLNSPDTPEQELKTEILIPIN